MTSTGDVDRRLNRPSKERGTKGGSWTFAAAALLIAGLFVLFGSLSAWGACPQEPCGSDGGLGLQHIYERSGVDFGPGVVTAVLGAVMSVLGILAARRVDRLVPLVGGVAAGGVLISVVLHLVMLYSDDERIVIGGPYLGLYVTVIGASVALAASLRLWRVRNGGAAPAPNTDGDRL